MAALYSGVLTSITRNLGFFAFSAIIFSAAFIARLIGKLNYCFYDRSEAVNDSLIKEITIIPL